MILCGGLEDRQCPRIDSGFQPVGGKGAGGDRHEPVHRAEEKPELTGGGADQVVLQRPQGGASDIGAVLLNDFLPRSLDKIRRLRDTIVGRGLKVQIEVDGGVDAANAPQLVEAGALILVAGTAVFAGGDPEAGARRIVDACR